MSLYETIGTNNPSYLLADPQGVDVIAIPCEPGNGIVKRGTIMYRKETGLWSPAAAENAIAANQLAVLDETVNTAGVATSTATIAEDARAYRAGRFIRGKVTLASDAAVTASVEVVLRTQGILFDQMVGNGTFKNTVNT